MGTRIRSAVVLGYSINKIIQEKGLRSMTKVHEYMKDNHLTIRGFDWVNDRHSCFKLVKEFPLIIYSTKQLKFFRNHARIKEAILESGSAEEWRVDQLSFDFMIPH